jgi:asparagine synthase (glutamine-hydrolysing)
MKLQLGLLYLDGRPTTLDDLAELLGERGHCPTDISDDIADGALIMAYRGDRISPEEESETQPLRRGPLILTWDGRLDNREEFADRLRLRDLEHTSDPAIVLQAYEAFGEGVFDDLIGEFALTLWCGRTKTLQFARSACGARPLYYVLDKDRLVWSSDFAHLVKISNVNLDLNDNYILEYLVWQPSTTHTPLKNVQVVPPNRRVRLEARQLKTRQLWDPTRISPLRFRTDQEYEELCHEKIYEAVRVRLRSKHPIFAELSGGLDSSTVVLAADKALRTSNHSPQSLQTVSFVYEESQSCDERPFIRTVEEKRGIETHLVRECDQGITLGLEENPEFTGLPNALHCFPGRYRRISKMMREQHASVLLTGGGGDHLFWSEPDGAPIVADEIRKANVLGAHKACRTWSRIAHIPYYEMLLSKSVPLTYGSIFLRNSSYKQPQIPAWIHSRHTERPLSTAPAFDGYASWCSSPSRRAQVFIIDHMFRQLGAGIFQEYPDLYVSHPYSHRPLIEFCLGVPVSQFLREGQTRSLMRRSLHDLLPRKTAKRVSKGLVDETIIRALQREWATTTNLEDWQICMRGYVDRAALVHCLKQLRLGILGLSGPLFRLFSLERWLRSLSHIRLGACQPNWACS